MARKKRTPKKPNPHKPYIKGFWKLFSLGVFTVFGVFLLASIGALGEMPDFRQLENPETNFIVRQSGAWKILLQRQSHPDTVR
jgi:penicillin-binding protein 1A